ASPDRTYPSPRPPRGTAMAPRARRTRTGASVAGAAAGGGAARADYLGGWGGLGGVGAPGVGGAPPSSVLIFSVIIPIVQPTLLSAELSRAASSAFTARPYFALSSASKKITGGPCL